MSNFDRDTAFLRHAHFYYTGIQLANRSLKVVAS